MSRLIIPRRRLLATVAAALACPRQLRAQSQLFISGGRRAIGRLRPDSIPTIDRSHPLSTGLVFYGYDTGTGVVLDLAGGKPGTRSPGATRAPNGLSQFEQGILWNSSDGVSFPADANIRAITLAGGYSFGCGYVKTGTVVSFATPFGRTANNNASSPFSNWSFDFNNSGAGQNVVRGLWVNGPSVQQVIATWNGGTDNIYHSLVGVVNPSVGATLYADGSLIGSNADTTTNSSNTNDAICFSGLSSAASQVPFVGIVYYGAFWSRPISQQEVLQFHFSPYDHLIF